MFRMYLPTDLIQKEDVDMQAFLGKKDIYCTRCNDNTDDDEKHFLLSCSYFMDERDTSLFELTNTFFKHFFELLKRIRNKFWQLTGKLLV